MRDVPLTEGLGAAPSVVSFIASLTSLNLEVVVPIGAAPVEQLPNTACWIGKKEQRPPVLILFDVDAFMGTKLFKLLLSYGDDDMAKDDGPER